MIPEPSIAAAAESGDGLRRFARHHALPGFGPEAQEKLRRSTVLCIGAGGLGSPALLYLAAAGVGSIRIVDDDTVDLSNLQRQILFTTADTGKSKAVTAAERLRALYPQINAEARVERFTAASAMGLASGCSLIIDGCDNFSTRYLSNDTAVLLGIPNVYGSIFRYEGQASVFAPCLGGPCYRCLFPVPPAPGTVPSCAEGGVLGVLPGLIGTIQATEAIKLLTGTGTPLTGRMLHVDTRTMQFRELHLRRDPLCPACGENRHITAPVDPVFTCDAAPAAPGISAAELRDLRKQPGTPLCLLDIREPWERLLTPWPEAGLAIPQAELAIRHGELPQAAEIIVVCSIGERSAEAVRQLTGLGFTRVRHLKRGLQDLLP